MLCGLTNPGLSFVTVNRDNPVIPRPIGWTTSLEYAAQRLGHSSTSFTMDTYQADIPSMGRAAADAADQLFGEEGGAR